MKVYEIIGLQVKDKAQEKRAKRIQDLTKKLINEGMSANLYQELDDVIEEIREAHGLDLEEAV